MKNDLFSIGPLTIHSYGLMIALGILVCVFMGMYRARKYGYKDEAVLDIAIFGILSGFIGAKLLYVLVEFDRFLENPMDVLGSEGFVVYGGIIVGALAGVLYCRIKKLPCWEYFDLLAPSIAVAQGFGRIGCFLAGCCYGRPTDAFWGVTFPEGSFAPAGVPLIPTQLISSVGDFAIAGILLLYNKRNKKAGNVGILYWQSCCFSDISFLKVQKKKKAKKYKNDKKREVNRNVRSVSCFFFSSKIFFSFLPI